MDIKINITDAAQSCLDQNQALWELWRNENLRKIILPVILAVLFITYGSLIPESNGKGFLQNNESSDNFQFFVTIGTIFLITNLLEVGRIIRKKSIFFRKVNNLATAHIQNANIVSIHLSEDNVEYHSHELTQKMKWTVFSHYKIYKNYIILVASNNMLSPIMIDRNFISDTEYSDLIRFIKSILNNKN